MSSSKTPEATAAISFASPIGWVNIGAANEKIVWLTMTTSQGHEFGKAKVLTEAKKQLQAYFAGKLTKFDLAVDLHGTEFQRSVWKQIAKIPFGKTVSYADIAVKIGKPLASRAVGGAVGSNPVALIVGCHRVMGTSGRITGYSGGEGIPTKRWLLAHEHIESVD